MCFSLATESFAVRDRIGNIIFPEFAKEYIAQERKMCYGLATESFTVMGLRN
jgi:hypothetical protein